MSETVSATDAARDLIVRLKTRYGSLTFMQSGGHLLVPTELRPLLCSPAPQ